MSMYKLTEVQRRRLQEHQDTIILILGSPSDEVAVRLANHIRDEITPETNNSEYIGAENLDEVPTAYFEADKGDTILLGIGRVLESNPPVARTLEQILSGNRSTPTTTIMISDRPGEVLRGMADFEVTPAVVGEVETVTPSREVVDEVERQKFAEIRVE